MIALISSIAAIIALLLEAWAQNAPQRKSEAADAEKQVGRQDLVNGNTDAIAVHIDGVLSDQTGAGSSLAGVESAEDIARRISRL